MDPAVQASDGYYGDISNWVWFTGGVNGRVEGTYTVMYSVADGGGNSAPSWK